MVQNDNYAHFLPNSYLAKEMRTLAGLADLAASLWLMTSFVWGRLVGHICVVFCRHLQGDVLTWCKFVKLCGSLGALGSLRLSSVTMVIVDYLDRGSSCLSFYCLLTKFQIWTASSDCLGFALGSLLMVSQNFRGVSGHTFLGDPGHPVTAISSLVCQVRICLIFSILSIF